VGLINQAPTDKSAPTDESSFSNKLRGFNIPGFKDKPDPRF